jgi:hypothetical protein
LRLTDAQAIEISRSRPSRTPERGPFVSKSGLGETAGRSKRGNQYLQGASKKSLFVYPLHRHARRLLVDAPSADDAWQGR